MNYIYYKDPKGNFGDDLNGWLWPQLFGVEQPDNDAFIGIGSILYNDSPLFRDLGNKRKIVFGTGIRPGYKNFTCDNTWDIRFLRGPLSAYNFNNTYEYIADAAYALRLTNDFNNIRSVKKQYEISVIPYFKSLEFFDWQAICDQLGFHYISPAAEKGVEHTLREIAASRYVIAEAMHGAIIADILRVPWSRFVLSTPFTEGGKVSEFKWMDWLHSIQLYNTESTPIQLYRKSSLHTKLKKMSGNMISAEFFVKRVVKDELLSKLRAIKHFHLSNDSVINSIDSRMFEKAAQLRQEIGFTPASIPARTQL
ncbi:polysaccharide pyruvyl transferase family protein [Chitinophaga agrisoli]|uniref:Polysaccharide pyruvyl transferase family protein n=1 Tax=Chitinophaga agrisoli TaxID=2607653 RepID=A0A5B2VWH1_9BACT|nr:polysaccharide pyruvyl transferase family protein [Chitinophaga agrisoli]KAA2243661.1 polysaccharide pyruvyl transferase family protein [Chitinophaga agrisoli]